MCFSCGFTMRAEPQQNDPWDFHCTIKPWCQFLVLSKGQAFLRKFKNKEPPILNGVLNEMVNIYIYFFFL